MIRLPHAVAPSPRSSALLVLGVALLLGTPAGAPVVSRAVLKAFFQEGPGRTTNQPYATDTDILLTYIGGLAGTASGSGVTSALYLYDSSGEPLTSGTGAVVCAPCLFETGGSSPRRRTISIEDLIVAHGGFGTSTNPRQGFMVLDVPNEADRLAAEVRIGTTHGTPGQPTVCPIKTRPELKDVFQNGDIPESYVIPTLGGATEWNVGDWAIFNATYMGGIGSVPAGTGATVELYLFDENGAPTSSQGTVCAPCTYELGNGGGSGSPRNIAFRFPPIPTASGQGFAVLRVAGSDPSSVLIEGTDVDSIPGPFPTLVITGSHTIAPLPPPETTLDVSGPDRPGAVLALQGSPNPASRELTLAFDLARAATVDLEMFDTAGRLVATVGSGARAAGHHELRWNRRNATGSALEAGVYYARLRAGDGSRITRVVLLPE